MNSYAISSNNTDIPTLLIVHFREKRIKMISKV